MNHSSQGAMPPLDPAVLRARLDWPDEALLGECDVHFHRTGGPGGQHRNKVSSAVRLVHRPTGFTVTGEERRSQHQNKANALLRLREAIAIGIRQPLPEAVRWPESVQIKAARLQVSEKNPAYWAVLALALDALAAHGAQVPAAAGALGVTTSSYTRFLADHPKAWIEANRLRKLAGLPGLKMR